jgi:U32 family peptidase
LTHKLHSTKVRMLIEKAESAGGGVRKMSKKDLIGKVIHYYDKIGVAVIKLEKGLKAEDKVKFTKDDNSFEQIIESMQLDHKPVTSGKKGEEVAIKVDQVVKSGTEIYKL